MRHEQGALGLFKEPLSTPYSAGQRKVTSDNVYLEIFGWVGVLSELFVGRSAPVQCLDITRLQLNDCGRALHCSLVVTYRVLNCQNQPQMILQTHFFWANWWSKFWVGPVIRTDLVWGGRGLSWDVLVVEQGSELCTSHNTWWWERLLSREN